MAGYLLPASSSAVALVDATRGEEWSYARLNEAVERLASRIAGGKRLVFVYGRNNPSSIVSYLAAVRAGHAVALLDPGVSDELQRALLERYEPDLIFHGGEVAPPGTDWVDGGEAGQDQRLARRSAEADKAIHPDLAVLLSTSGSTGSPKLVRLTQAGVEHNAGAIIEALGIHAGERAISSLPLYYSYGMSVVNTHLAAGASLVLTDDGLTGAGFWDAFRKYECSSLAGVPYSYQMLRRLDIDNLRIPSLRTMTQAGGKLNVSLVLEFHSKIVSRDGGRFFVMYGQTEAGPRITTLPAEALPAKAGSAGPALRDGAIEIVADDGPAREANVEGDVCYRGPNVMMGYAQRQEDLALGDELGGRLETGDLGKLDEDGFLHVTGRLKRIAKVFGLRINLDEVEQMLRRHGPAAVIGDDERLRALCEFGGPEDLDRIGKQLCTDLSLHPSALRMERVEGLPLKPNGKIDYSAIERNR